MPPRGGRQRHIPLTVRLNFITMGLHKRIFPQILFCLSTLTFGCSPIVKEYVGYNHLSMKDSLSQVDYSHVDINTNTVQVKSFEIENPVQTFKSDEIPQGSELYKNLINNVVVNEFISWEAIEREVSHKGFISKILVKHTKNTFTLPEYRQVDYYKYFPDTTVREYKFFMVGRIELSDSFKSYVIASNKLSLFDKIPVIKKSEYYLLNIDHNHQLISTLLLASSGMIHDGLGTGNDQLRTKIKIGNRVRFIYTSNNKSLDLPQNPEVNHRYTFTLRIRNKGEIKL